MLLQDGTTEQELQDSDKLSPYKSDLEYLEDLFQVERARAKIKLN